MTRPVVSAPVEKSAAEAREDRFRVALGFAMALLLVSAFACCCFGGLLIQGTDDGGQTRTRPHPRGSTTP